jgi:myosin-crossreactive antigen
MNSTFYGFINIRGSKKMDIEREKIDFDVLFVGGGPASLAGAIRLMQLDRKGCGNRISCIERRYPESHRLRGAASALFGKRVPH